jgi:hypothetical protein
LKLFPGKNGITDLKFSALALVEGGLIGPTLNQDGCTKEYKFGSIFRGVIPTFFGEIVVWLNP